ILALFKQADANGDGVIDAKEAEKNRVFRGLFKAIDRDGDGKVTEKEVDAYLDTAANLQTRAAAACVTLVLSDQSRGLFDLMDTRRDGRLGLRDLRGAANLLTQLDRDGKGYLTRADIPRSYALTLRRGAVENNNLNGAAAFVKLYSAAGRYE